MRESNQLTETEIAYIVDHHENTPVKDMALYLKRGNKTIYDYMQENNMPVFRLQPARRGNRELVDKRMFCIPDTDLITGFKRY